MVKIRVDWDTEDCDEFEPPDLPETVELPDEFDDLDFDDDDDQDTVTEWLSDTFGYTVFGWYVDESSDFDY